MSVLPESAATRDRGTSLVELLVSLVLVGVIAAVCAAVLSVTFRSTPGLEDRIDDARTLQGLVTWLPQDVDSTPPDGFDTAPTTASGCTQSPGTNLLRLEWSEDVGTGLVRFVANYRYVLVDSAYRIQRVTCNGIGAGPLGSSTALGASSALPPLPAGWQPGDAPIAIDLTTDLESEVTIVSFEVTTLEGKVVRIDSAPKNPANTLPTTTTTPESVTTTTTTEPPVTTTTVVGATTTTVVGATTTTTLAPATTTTAPPACVVTSVVASPTSLKNTEPNGNGKSATNVGVLAQPVTVTVTTTGWCVGLEARAQTGAPNGELFRNFTANGSTYTVVFPGYPQGSSELWADGSRTISFYSPTGGPYGSVTLDVK